MSLRADAALFSWLWALIREKKFCARECTTSAVARVITTDWETSDVPLQKGVYQGDPLSVVIFNTVMNTILDTMSLRVDLGYRFANSPQHVNILQYADDTCLLANSPAACQLLLNITADWLQWSGMVAKIPKYQSVCLLQPLQGN